MAVAAPLAAVAAVLALLVTGALGANNDPTVTAAFSGGVSIGGTTYAKNGTNLTLTLTTSNVKCVDVTGAIVGHQQSATAKSTWTFTTTAGAGNGVQTATVTATGSFNNNNACNTTPATTSASYILDNTGPVVTGALTPAPNAAGWNKGDVSVAWSATDAGVGVGSGPTPASDSQSASTAGVTKSATATDRLGNAGNGSVTIKLDKNAPTIGTTRSPAANANGWNNGDVTVSYGCSDALSGIASCSAAQTLSTQGAGQSATGTAADNAGNTASASVSDINIDKAAPTISGAISGGTLGDNGWYRSDVTVHWTCADSLSGIAGSCPADGTIGGEGQNLSATGSVSDRAGNAASAQSPAVKIDQTAPNTGASAVDAWNNVDVDVTLTPNDALSGVAETRYRIDGGTDQSGTAVRIASEGKHTLEFWSVDKAGNREATKSIAVNIDKSSPTITHALSPAPNANGWNAGDVHVTFTCDDALSGIASCGPDLVVAVEGRDQDASGTARDNAGNTATDPATVSIDKTAPTITAAADRAPNADHWYDDDVTVSFTCGDDLSGVDTCPAPKILGEGADQSASASVADAAGNTAGAGVSPINIDKTAPSLHGSFTSGWHHDDVVVTWSCDDALSGIKGDCPADSTVTGEGDNLSASAAVADHAGNERAVTVEGITIDRTAPSTTAKVADPLLSGWYAGAVDVELKAVDALSGVAKTYYKIDDGDAQVYDHAFSFGQKGKHTIMFWSVDVAGNTEDADAPGHQITIKIDDVAPTIDGHRTPAANAFGWTNGDVTVAFDCDDHESGIADCTGPVPVTNEGADQSVEGSATDAAGNQSSALVDHINIDKTAPELVGTATTDPNADHWYNGDVTVHWAASDALSGIDGDTVPADSVITGEGEGLGTGSVSVSDRAGNSASASYGDVDIDRTAPTITGAPTTDAGPSGWYRGAVTVHFACSDALSGVAGCPADMVADTNGNDVSVTSDEAFDRAGNTAAGKTVGGLKIDGLAPQTSADNQCTKSNGWCTGTKATVLLTAQDQIGLSGVKEIHYTIDGGPEQVADGASASVDVALDGSGEAIVRYFAVDNAGNRETAQGVSLEYDNIAPTVTHSVSPKPNAADWNRDDVTVHFTAKDDDTGSGVDANTVTPDVLVGDETGGLLVAGSALDVAGNKGTDSVTVKLDKTAPSIDGAIVSGQRGDGGWWVGPVTVGFTCSDALSGIAICAKPVTLTDNGAGQSASGEALDRAGNGRTAEVRGIAIDNAAPAITLKGIENGAIYTLGAVPAPTCTAQDDLSGAGTCSVRVTGGRANGVGTFSYTATANDKAGNTATRTGTYRVIYRFDGFLQPINDTAHQTGVQTSIFKAGSTVPAKLQLKRADGTVVAANDLPSWETPAKGGLTTAPVGESLYSAAVDSGSTFRWSSSDQQYLYNWGTSAGDKGSYERIGVRLDDGQTYLVYIGLR